MAVRVERRLFDVHEYRRMAEARVIAEDDRVELIEGEIVKMAAIGSLHAACVARLTRLFGRLTDAEAIVWVQNPIRLDASSEPEPDVALLKPRDDFYAAGHPTPGDVLLLIEVADTSLEYDREIKVPLYARAGISETWLVDLSAEAVWTYAGPENGVYTSTGPFRRGDALPAPRAFSDLALSVDQVLG